MKRRLLRLGCLLLLGATLNVAVAWGCVLRLPPFMSGNERPMSVDEIADRLTRAATEIPNEWIEGTYAAVQSRFGWTSWAVATGDPDLSVFVDVDHINASWPVHGLTGHQVFDGRRSTGYEWATGGALSVPEWFRAKRTGQPALFINPVYARVEFVPFRPLWPGFAINTLFYAGVLWVLFCGPFALRRMIRRRRGRCPACAYPVGSSPVCTECGASLGNAPSLGLRS